MSTIPPPTPQAPAAPPAPPEDSFYTAAYEVTKGSITRSRSGAEFVEKAAAGILAVYSAALTVSFSVKDNPLPLRGVIPAAFLALALVFSAFYLGYPSQWSRVDRPIDETKQGWFNEFAVWMEGLVNSRTNYLRASLVALACGALFLPAAFLHVETTPADPPAKAEWPTPPSDSADLQKILFKAQVAEVAKLREKAAPASKGEFAVKERWIWFAAAGGLLLIILVLIFGATSPSKGRGIIQPRRAR